jgi:hypothetical protein
MKKLPGLVCFFAIFVFCAGFTGAVCDNNNQIILRLNANDNAHGALWNETDYGITLCYNNYFSGSFGGNVHDDCSGHEVIKLSSKINAHAGSLSSNYPITVCHTGLSACEIINQSEGCPSGKRKIFYLSSRENAHISDSNTNYPFAVCCNGIGGLPLEVTPGKCADYNTESACTGDMYRIGKYDPGCPSSRRGMTGSRGCFCKWNANVCSVAFNSTIATTGCSFTCLFNKISETECSEQGFQDIVLQGSAIDKNPAGCSVSVEQLVSESCTRKEIPIRCALTIEDLPFFGAWQFFASAAGIFIAYLALRRRWREVF